MGKGHEVGARQEGNGVLGTVRPRLFAAWIVLGFVSGIMAGEVIGASGFRALGAPLGTVYILYSLSSS